MLDFRVDTFLEVCRCMNYTKAAEQLHITQPAVSQHIHFLEAYYHTKLFLYEGKKLRMTKEGELLYRMASAHKQDALYLKSSLKAGNNKSIDLYFGVTLTIGEFVIADALAQLLGKHPDISVHVITANTQELLRKIKHGDIQFAVMEGNFPKEEYDSVIYSKENFIPVCSAKYCFHRKIGRLEDLIRERLIIREEGSGTREVLVKDLERRNLTVQDFSNVIEIGNMSAIKSLVSYGCGISFMYEAAVDKELKEGSISRITLEDFEVVHDFSFVWQKGSFFDGEYRQIFNELRIKKQVQTADNIYNK